MEHPERIFLQRRIISNARGAIHTKRVRKALKRPQRILRCKNAVWRTIRSSAH